MNEKTTYTAARKRAIYRHQEKIERLYVTVPAGRKAVYQAAADAAGQSLNGFVVDCVETVLKATEMQQEDQDPTE